MADPVVLNDATIWYGGYDLSGASNEVIFSTSRQENPDSRFGDAIEAVYPGPLTVGVEAKGFWDSTLDGPEFTQLTNPSSSWPLVVCPDGGDDSELAYSLRAYTFSYGAIEAAWGDSLPYRVSARSQTGGRLGRGRVMLPKATYSATADGTKYQLGAITSSQKLVATLHVFSAVTGTWDFDIESDANAAAGGEVTRGSFSQVTAGSGPTQQVVEVSGPVTDTYWLVEMTETAAGSIVCAVTYSIVDA